MQIIWHGQSCFEIIAAKGKGEHITVLIDPLDEGKTGIKNPKTDAQIVLLTNRAYTADDADLKKIAPGAFVVDGPGEYEARGVYLQGTASADGNTIYAIEVEEMKLCHLGNLQEAELSQEEVERIGNIDILMAPVGNGKDLGAKETLKVISQIEPSIVVPMNYEIPKLKLDANSLSEFLKAAGLGEAEPLPKLTIKRKDISAEEAKIIVLTP
jgi:hypothetical protein